ncbi:MAG: LTA synthase family protein [Ruminococcaceae bacterium]|nr:LTA synthase family protein [Oscillospiraceae bacterium]
MKEKITNFFAPLFLVLKSLFTPMKRGILLNNKLSPLFRIIGYLSLIIFPLCSYVTLEFVHYSSLTRLFSFLENRQAAVVFGVGVIYLLFVLFLLVLKRGYLAAGTLTLVTVIFSVSNYFKFQQVGDYLYPWDIVQNVGNVGELSEFLTISFPWENLVLYLGLLLLTLIIFFTKADLNVKLIIRLPLIMIIVLSTYKAVETPQKSTELLNKNSLYFEDMALQTSNYSANGFVGAFVVNTLSSGVTEPENYSREEVEKILQNYTETGAGENFKSPDVILILSESFWDPTLLPDTNFSHDPLENFRLIASRDGAISGKFYTTGFGGGTVRPEFEVLTGLTTDYLPGGSVPYQYITKDTESYVSLFSDMGYNTIALHPYTSSFYLRKQGYPYIGFDELHFEDELYALKDVPLTISGKQISDSSFVDYIKYYLDKSQGNTFLFGISMENHQPYTNKFSTFDIEVTSSTLSSGILSEVQNFTQGVYEADLALKKLVDYIDSREKETVLVYFGDHLPTLGANYGAYRESGAIDLNGMTGDMNKFLYSTPFLIYSNFPLEESEMVKVGGDNEIASYNILNALSTLIDSPRSRYMYFLEDYFNHHKAYNVRLWSINAIPFKKYVNAHAMITYDRTVGEKYSEK